MATITDELLQIVVYMPYVKLHDEANIFNLLVAFFGFACVFRKILR